MGEIRDLFNKEANVPAEIEAAHTKREALQKTQEKITPQSVLLMREPAKSIANSIIIDPSKTENDDDKSMDRPINLYHVDLNKITNPANAVQPIIFAIIRDKLTAQGCALSESQVAALNNYIQLQKSGILDRRAHGLGTSSSRELALTNDLHRAILQKKCKLLADHMPARVVKLVDDLHHEIRTKWTSADTDEAKQRQVEAAKHLASELGTRLTGSIFLDSAAMLEHIMTPLTASGTIDISQRRNAKTLALSQAVLADAMQHQVALSRLANDHNNVDLANAAKTEQERDLLLAQAGAQASIAYIKGFVHDIAQNMPLDPPPNV